MKKFWFISYLIEALLLVIGLILSVLSIVIGVIAWAITQDYSNCVTQFCDPVIGVVVNYIGPVFMFLFVINGFHAFASLNKEVNSK